MKAEEEHHSGKKYKATTMTKLPVNYKEKQTELKYLRRNRKQQTDSIITDINHCLNSETPANIREGLNALSYLLTTDKKEYFQNIAPQFIPRVLKLLDSFHQFLVKLESLKYLVRVVSFGKLSEECLKLFESEVQMLLRILKNGRAEYQCKLFILMANLTIDSIKMRNIFIQKGVIEEIIQAFQQDLEKSHLYPISSQFKQNAYFALIAFSLGDPLPPRHKVEKAVDKVRTKIDAMYWFGFGSFQTTCGAIWLLYHYSDYRNQQKCSLLLKNLLKLNPQYFYQQQQKTMLDAHFNSIFMQIYDYYSDRPHNSVMPILHGCCYLGKLQKQYYSQVIFRMYIPKMYLQLFRTAVRHKMTKISRSLVKPWKQAVCLLQEEDESQHLQLVLEFISWILNPLVKKREDAPKGFKKLPYQQKDLLNSEFLADLKLNLTHLKFLRHKNQRNVAYLSSKIINKYHQLANKDWHYQVCIKV